MLGRIVGNPEVLQGILQVVKRTMHASFEGLVLSGAGEKFSVETATMLGKAAIQNTPVLIESASSKIAPVVESMFSLSINMLLSLSSRDVAKIALEKTIETLQSPAVREELSEMMVMNISSFVLQKAIGEGSKGIALTNLDSFKPSKAVILTAIDSMFSEALVRASEIGNNTLDKLNSIFPNSQNPYFTQYMIDELAKLSEVDMVKLQEEVINSKLSEADFIERLKSLSQNKLPDVPTVINVPDTPVVVTDEKLSHVASTRQQPILSKFGITSEKPSLAAILEKVPSVDIKAEEKKDSTRKPS